MTGVLAFSVAILLFGKMSHPWLESHIFVLTIVAALVCLVLGLWMYRGGSQSPLWLWLPPFCFFPNATWIRWIVVVGMIIGTAIGILKSFQLLSRA